MSRAFRSIVVISISLLWAIVSICLVDTIMGTIVAVQFLVIALALADQALPLFFDEETKSLEEKFSEVKQKLKKIFSFLLVLVIILSAVTPKAAMAYVKLEAKVVSLETPRTSTSLLIGYQHEYFFVLDNKADFGAFFKAEKCQFEGGCGNAVVEIYKVPNGKTAVEVLPTFSNGGADLVKVFLEDNYDLLEKGEYIIKLIGPKSMTRVNLTLNPKRVP